MKSRRLSSWLGIAFLAQCCAVPFLHSDVVQLFPVADTSIFEVAPDNNLGGQPHINSGTTQNFTKNRALILFDPASAIPPMSFVESVSLTLEVTRQPVDGFAASTFSLHRMLVPWGEGNKVGTAMFPGFGAPATEGEATWNERFAMTGQDWGAPGGAAGIDYIAAPTASQFVFGVNESPYVFGPTPQLAADVQFWLDNPSQNFGWMIISQSEELDFTARRFGSREDPLNAPILTVQFEVIPEPGTTAMLVIGCLALLGIKARRRG